MPAMREIKHRKTRHTLIISIALGLVLYTSLALGADAPGKPIINQFYAEPGIIQPGENAVLRWNVSDATSILIKPGDLWLESDVWTQGQIQGSMAVSPLNDTTYTMTAEGDGGGATANVSVIVREIVSTASVKGAASVPVINFFRADRPTISAGDQVVLSWSVTGATEAFISGLGNIAMAGSATLMPMHSTAYTLTARNGQGVSTSEVKVSVEPPRVSRPIISFFGANPGVIEPGGRAVLSWSVTGAEGAVIDNGIGMVGPRGSISVSPTRTTVFTLKASNPGGSSTASAQVSLAQPQKPVVEYFVSDRRQILTGESTTLSWSVSGASSVTISPGFGRMGPAGVITVAPSETTTYVLRASNAGGNAVRMITVEVVPITIFRDTPAGPVEGDQEITPILF